MKKLVIAEKPSVGKDIAKVLGCKKANRSYIEGNGYIVTWAMGHLVTLSDPESYDKKYATWDLDQLPIIFDRPKFSILSNTRSQYNQIEKLINKSDVREIIIATDAGREGELVARLILLKARNKKPIKRLWISSNTDKAIKDGFKNLVDGKKYDGLYKAALSRSIADWILGINATRALTTKYSTQLSCGRVQTPTLEMIRIQDDKVREFKPKLFYTISANTMQDIHSLMIKGIKNDEIEEFEKIKSKLSNKQLVIKDIKKKVSKVHPTMLYDLTLLQREANHLYGYSAKQTLDIMQSLYEYHKVVSYPRTDSNYLTSDILGTLKSRVNAVSNMDYVDLKSINYKNQNKMVNNNKVTDHHAIIPTEQKADFSRMESDQIRIYNLIVKRFLSFLMDEYVYETLTITSFVDNYEFKCSGKRDIDLGFKKLNVALVNFDDEQEEQALKANYKIGQKLQITNVSINQNYTRSPKFFTEGSLLAAMENPVNYVDDQKDKKVLTSTGGIGTVATRADIIEKLFNTNVVEKNGNHINITNKGRQLLNVAPISLKSVILTSKWESDLKLIEQNKLKDKIFTSNVEKETRKIIDGIKSEMYEFKHDNMTEQKCEKCSTKMLVSKSKNGRVLTCMDPSCNNKVYINIPKRNQCPNCMKKLIIIGEKFEKQALFCEGCGYRKNLLSLLSEQKNEVRVLSKKERIKLAKKQEKRPPAADNPFADLFK